MNPVRKSTKKKVLAYRIPLLASWLFQGELCKSYIHSLIDQQCSGEGHPNVQLPGPQKLTKNASYWFVWRLDTVPKNPLIYNTTIKVAISWGLIPHFHTPALDTRAPKLLTVAVGVRLSALTVFATCGFPKLGSAQKGALGLWRGQISNRSGTPA